jgi:DNA-directed RNA polymerase omega subunit
MFKVSFQKLLKSSGGQYKLLMMAFQRTHQLNAGMPPTIKSKSKKNVTIALQEIAEGKVRLAEDGSEETTSDE